MSGDSTGRSQTIPVSAPTRLLVVGASGLIGTEIARAADDRTVLGVARSIRGLASEEVDLLDLTSVERAISKFRPDAVVIASAWPWVDGCEQDPERSERENVGTVRNLLSRLTDDVRVVFYSSDHLFDGREPSYQEDSTPRPLSVYARHKREAEYLLLVRGNALIVRTSYVFGAEDRMKNFLYRVVEAHRTGRPLRVPARQAGTPTWSKWLAASTLELLDRGTLGVVHLTGPEVLTKAEWARLLAAGLGLDRVTIQEVSADEAGQVAPRPERVQLASSRHVLRHPPLLDVLRENHAAFLAGSEGLASE